MYRVFSSCTTIPVSEAGFSEAWGWPKPSQQNVFWGPLIKYMCKTRCVDFLLYYNPLEYFALAEFEKVYNRAVCEKMWVFFFCRKLFDLFHSMLSQSSDVIQRRPHVGVCCSKRLQFTNSILILQRRENANERKVSDQEDARLPPERRNHFQRQSQDPDGQL